jgi:hypothetical protein
MHTFLPINASGCCDLSECQYEKDLQRIPSLVRRIDLLVVSLSKGHFVANDTQHSLELPTIDSPNMHPC